MRAETATRRPTRRRLLPHRSVSPAIRATGLAPTMTRRRLNARRPRLERSASLLGLQLGRRAMRSAGPPSSCSASTTDAKLNPLMPGPSSTTAKFQLERSPKKRRSPGPIVTWRSKGSPRGRSWADLRRYAPAAQRGSDDRGKYGPMLLTPTHTTACPRHMAASCCAASTYCSGYRA